MGGTLNAFRKGRSVQPVGFSIVCKTEGLSDTGHMQIASPFRPLGPRVSQPFACVLASAPSAAVPVVSFPRELAFGLSSDVAATHNAMNTRVRAFSLMWQMLSRGAKAWNCAILGYVPMLLPK